MKNLRDFFDEKDILEMPPVKEKITQELKKIKENLIQALEKGKEYRRISEKRYKPSYQTF